MTVATRWVECADRAEMAAAAVARILAAAREGIAARGRFDLVLAGGETPRETYRRLAAVDAEWPAWRIWFGDERCVAPDDPERNSRMADDSWLRHVPIPRANVHPIAGELGAQRAATEYRTTLRDVGLFDCVLLGLGEDGHTASLFPGSPLLEERSRWVAAVDGAAGTPPLPRITLTFPALRSAREAAFIVSGERKRAVLERLLAGDSALPAARLRSAGGLRIFADRAAAPAALP